ncbi:hypothetical protein LCGC14_2915780 [marine sediment metagenome]|uniref:Uncharacterized protein n=1 Tax=marine sediment metagenome TaxID=412755 RepID=A0A0F8YC44_9ZZZZ
MDIKQFINFFRTEKSSFITRGSVLDVISVYNDDWVLMIKALLITNNVKYIQTSYLLEKVSYIYSHPNNPEAFLDYKGLAIYKALKR